MPTLLQSRPLENKSCSMVLSVIVMFLSSAWSKAGVKHAVCRQSCSDKFPVSERTPSDWMLQSDMVSILACTVNERKGSNAVRSQFSNLCTNRSLQCFAR
eukprot:4457816-Amphidinium_carterae.2